MRSVPQQHKRSSELAQNDDIKKVVGVEALAHGAQYQTSRVINHRPLESIAHLSEILPEKADADIEIASVRSTQDNRGNLKRRVPEN